MVIVIVRHVIDGLEDAISDVRPARAAAIMRACAREATERILVAFGGDTASQQISGGRLTWDRTNDSKPS